MAVVVVLLVSIVVVQADGGRTSRVRITGPAGVELPSGAVRDGAWVMVPKRAAGIDAGAALNATASNGPVMLVAGTRRARDPRSATIWRSVDGLHFAKTEHPAAAQTVTAIAMAGSRALAVSAPGAPEPYVWSSDDSGRSWREIARGELFGKPVPHNRDGAFVAGLVRYDGWWVAYGGAADGYEGIWTSRDGIAWKQVLDSRTSGSIDGIVRLADGSLMAYGVDGSGRTSGLSIGWFTRDATAWGAAQPLSTPPRYYLASVAAGATLGVAESIDRHGVTTVVRSSDGGRTWSEDTTFRFPSSWEWTAARAAGIDIVTGTTATGSPVPGPPRVWTATGPGTWSSSLPSRFELPTLPTTTIPQLPRGRAVRRHSGRFPGRDDERGPGARPLLHVRDGSWVLTLSDA